MTKGLRPGNWLWLVYCVLFSIFNTVGRVTGKNIQPIKPCSSALDSYPEQVKADHRKQEKPLNVGSSS